MKAVVTKRDTGRARRDHTKPDKQVGPDRPALKRLRGTKDEDATGHMRKSLRIQESLNRRHRSAERKVESQPPHKTRRLREISDLNQQFVKQVGKRTRPPPRTTRTHLCVRQEQSQRRCRITRASRNCQNIPGQASGTPVHGNPVSTRKRHRDQDDVVTTEAKRRKSSGYQAQPSRSPNADIPPLTLENLKRLDRKVHSEHVPSAEETALGQWKFVNMPKSQKTETKSRQTEDTSSSTKTVSTTDTRFRKIAVKNGVLIPMQYTEPSNVDEIRNYLNRPRESASPDVAVYRNYLWKAVTADNEETVKQAVLAQLKDYKDGHYRQAFNQQFTEYPSNVGFNNGLCAAKPDLIEGITLEAFEPYPVKDQLGGAAVPTPSLFPITLAHMAGEFKRPGGNLIAAESQAAYDGASLVYGRNTARESMGKTDSLSAAHVGSFISDGKHIMTFAHYAMQDSSGNIVYHLWPATDTNIQMSHESFRTGRRQLRNLQDWTRENSYSLQEELVDHYKFSQAQRTEQPIPEAPEENEFSQYDNGSKPYVLVDRPTQAESHPVLEPETSYITPQSSDSARSRRYDHLAPNADIAKRVPNQRHTRSSARLSERRRQEERG